MTPEDFAQQSEAIFALGAAMQGGCCGTTPAHIAALVAHLHGRKPLPPRGTDERMLCSARNTLALGATTAANGVSEFATLDADAVAEALQTGDGEDLCDAAMELEGDGAALLTLPLPAGAEPTRAAALVEQLQSATQLPLRLPFADAAVLEAALRRCNGVPLVRCTNAEDRRAAQAVAEKYGAVGE
jgi:5-methyltetrahydrofolate--homocysteine methyltransferase